MISRFYAYTLFASPATRGGDRDDSGAMIYKKPGANGTGIHTGSTVHGIGKVYRVPEYRERVRDISRYTE